jgi:predicted nucleotidyltransferase
MNSQEAVAILMRHQNDLQARGVLHAALFGSVARGEARPDSDVDIMVELDPRAELDLFGYVGLTRYIAELFPSRVDVVHLEALIPHVRPSAEKEAIHAF